MSENDDFENKLRRVIGHPRPIDTNEEKESKNKETDLTEKTALSQGDPFRKAKEDVGLALWEGIRKIIPFVVSLVWVVFALAVIIIVFSLLFLWGSYVYSIWDKPEEILPLLVKVRDLAAATALGALLTYTRLRR